MVSYFYFIFLPAPLSEHGIESLLLFNLKGIIISTEQFNIYLAPITSKEVA